MHACFGFVAAISGTSFITFFKTSSHNDSSFERRASIVLDGSKDYVCIVNSKSGNEMNID
jgi:hypothetical protein